MHQYVTPRRVCYVAGTYRLPPASARSRATCTRPMQLDLHTEAPRWRVASGARSLSSESDIAARAHTRACGYGCNFILNPTTPGSSVADTANPHDFANAIIAVFSRNASPTIHAVPRDRAYSMMRVIISRPSPLPF